MVLAAWVLLSPAIALAMFGGFDEYGSTPSREAAREATKLWHETVGPDPQIMYVAGTERYALGLMFYSPTALRTSHIFHMPKRRG